MEEYGPKTPEDQFVNLDINPIGNNYVLVSNMKDEMILPEDMVVETDNWC